MRSYLELVQLIMENDDVYSYLINYYLDLISDQAFEDFLNAECQKGKTVRQVHAEYMASWIPWESSADKLCERIRKMADEE